MMGDFLQPTTTRRLAEEGLEECPNSSGITNDSPLGAAESGAIDADSAEFDPDVRTILRVWPCLPVDMKAAIMAIIRATASVK